ncbi:DUF6286 domain-containing protein [Arthrobacter sp. zg-Y40]|uniref:DUF6286 domain-containing protein n=1 Tax=Arthrobacter sp. zg-Y40 TaxID=2886939 RepID=UPI001D13CEB7|nr:DUF6286 domain-containing protein [Arthrobacter sp. zg-Y40]
MKRADVELTDRIVKRETHSARTPAAVTAAAIGILFFAYVLLETVLQALGQDAWLIDPPTFWRWLANLPARSDPLILGLSGGLIFLAGLLFFLQAVLPGWRARYALPNPRAAVVVDGEVLAASLARCARTSAGVTPQQVLVTVGRMAVDVQIRPTSGTPVDPEAVRAAVEEELQLTKLNPQPAVRVQVASSGVIGQ